MSDKTRRLACLDLNRNFKDRTIINDDNGDNEEENYLNVNYLIEYFVKLT